MNVYKLSVMEIDALAKKLALKMKESWFNASNDPIKVYAIPRGGIAAALAVGQHINLVLVNTPQEADCFIDDLIDSGATYSDWTYRFQGVPFYALINRLSDDTSYSGKWLVFPWEENEHSSIQDNITRLIQFVGDDPNREGLLETPARVAKAWREWCSGYGKNAKDILKVFEDGAENYNEMVMVKDIPIYSKCEHHMADIFGTATIAYIPNGKIVGLSKLSRLADMFAKRLQVQERLTAQIADALFEELDAKGVGVVIKARHMCMESRGVCQQGHHTRTSALRGVMLTDAATRAEFLQLAQ